MADAQPNSWFVAALWVGGIVLGLIVLHNLSLWMERRGWVYYKYRKGGGTAASNVFVQIQSFVDPSVEHLLETRQEIKQERRAEDNEDPYDEEDRTA